jgi:hypothetical protein
LVRSVPFYSMIANHDMTGKDANGHETANFTYYPDALSYYTALHLPLNGPGSPTKPAPMAGPAARLEAFRVSAGARFSRMANYSFDCPERALCTGRGLHARQD